VNRRVERTPTDAPVAAAARVEAPRGGARSWLDQHLYSALSSLGRLWSRRAATVLTVLVMGLALALPLLLSLMVENLRGLGGALTDSREVAAFLRSGATPDAVAAAAAAARALPGVESVEVRDPDAGLDELRRLQGFGEALDAIGDNPLPHVLVIAPTAAADGAAVAALADAAGAIDGVDFVQYDLAWRQRLDAVLALASRVAWVAGVLLALGALLVVGNTIRLDVAARADEIAIVQLLGGTDGFVRRPFLYAGAWYGLFAALVAIGGAWLAWAALTGPVARLAQTYGTVQALEGPGWAAQGAVLAAGIVLGWLGAWAAVGRQLAQGRPR
jgi:cell division transport system permease protein